MKLLFSLFLLFSFSLVHAKKPVPKAKARKVASIEYTCTVKWKTLFEDLPEKKVKFKRLKNVKVSDNLDVLLSSDGAGVTVKVIQPFTTDPGDSVSYSFFCDPYLNCEGNETKTIKGKVSSVPLSISPSGYTGKGSIEGREVFNFNALSEGTVEYSFIAYKDEKNQPMGLKVVCHE